jgi:hypothetical protein
LTANLPALVAPVAPTRLIPMPVFYDNAPLSLLSVMFFPDDLDLARKCVAHFLSYGTLQSTLGAGVQIDKRYMSEIISDLADGEPSRKLVARRRHQASACGQIVKVLFALTNSDDAQVRDRATWELAIKIAEREIGHTIRKSGSSLHAHLRRFRPALHIAAAFEMAKEEAERPPLNAEALMLNAMTLFERLKAWDTVRGFRGRRSDHLTGDIFWRWHGGDYVDHGVADIGYPFDNLIPHNKGGRPRKRTLKIR